jgi:hypothetical protein
MSTATQNRVVGPRFLRLDLPFGRAQPRAVRVLIALVAAVVLSVAACWALATAAVALMPSTAGYEHFGFQDYAKLTVIGVVIAALAWPVVTLLSSHAHRIYLLADVVVVLISLAPDLWIIRGGQPIPAVLVLMLMHVALGVITYPVMVYGAPQRT